MIPVNNSESDNRLLLKNPNDIRALLNKLQRRRSRITGHFDSSSNIFSTSIVHVGESLLILDDTCELALAERILTSNKLMFSTICSGAPVSFVASHIERCVFEGLAAFAVTIPNTVHWIQRRQYTRIREDDNTNAVCTIVYDNGITVRNPLSDISAGGIGMFSRPSSPAFKAGTQIDNCYIELPGQGKLALQIRVCSSATVTLNNGNYATRYGCQFVDLAEQEHKQILSYLAQRAQEAQKPQISARLSS